MPTSALDSTGDAERETLARACERAESERVTRKASIFEIEWDAAYKVQDTTLACTPWPIVNLSACALESWVELERAGEQVGKVRCDVTTFAISNCIVDVTTKSKGPIFTPWLDGDVVRATFVATLPKSVLGKSVIRRVTLAQFECAKPERFGPNNKALAPVREFTRCALGGRNDGFALLSVGVMGPFEKTYMMAQSFE